MRMRRLAVVAAIGLVVAAAPAQANANSVDTQPLNVFGTTDPVGQGAHTTLNRTADGVTVGVHSRGLTAGNAYTVWLVIFNTPDGCATDPCGEPDLMNPDAHASVIWSGVGGVASHAGVLNGRGGLDEGNPQGRQQLFADLGAPDPGFVDAQGAEIHFVVRDHGPATGNPDQTTTFEGDCTPESSFGLGAGSYDCNDPQASIHQP